MVTFSSLNEDKSINLIKLAKNTTDLDTLEELSHNPTMKVRKFVALNINTPAHIINRLVFDPTTNVSYNASVHKNCSIQRKNFDEKDINHPCVPCNLLTDSQYCNQKCEKIAAFNS
jgi:hypothetical protein